jgi:hypothetical protein
MADPKKVREAVDEALVSLEPLLMELAFTATDTLVKSLRRRRVRRSMLTPSGQTLISPEYHLAASSLTCEMQEHLLKKLEAVIINSVVAPPPPKKKNGRVHLK